VEAIAWATYVGGAIVMEFVWRPAQRDLPAAQTAVACQVMGRRYRWLALFALVVVAGAGAARVGDRGAHDSLALSDPYGRTIAGLAVCWVVVFALVTSMAFVAHPALHVRTPADLDASARAAARAEVARAIRRMDVVLRAELVVALLAVLLGAALRSGGL
jgi:uncharacterized membrane protein